MEWVTVRRLSEGKTTVDDSRKQPVLCCDVDSAVGLGRVKSRLSRRILSNSVPQDCRVRRAIFVDGWLSVDAIHSASLSHRHARWWWWWHSRLLRLVYSWVWNSPVVATRRPLSRTVTPSSSAAEWWELCCRSASCAGSREIGDAPPAAKQTRNLHAPCRTLPYIDVTLCSLLHYASLLLLLYC